MADGFKQRPALYRALEDGPLASLISSIDWDATPSRSLASIGLWAVLAGLSLLLPIAAALLLIGLLAWMSTDAASAMAIPVATTLAFVAVLGSIVAATNLCTFCMRAGRRELSKFPDSALFAPRRPVLYLRDFKTENAEFEEDNLTTGGAVSRGIVSYFVGPLGFLLFSMGRSDRSFENLLAKTVTRIGPLVGLNDPLMRNRPGEVRRLYIKSSTWQSAVSTLIPETSLAVMVYKAGANLNWEAEQVLSRENLPVLIWLRSMPVPDGWREGQDYFPALPNWLRLPLEQAGFSTANLGHPYDDRLMLFDANRKLLLRPCPTGWKPLKQNITQLLREARIKAVRNPNAKRHRSTPVQAARLALWSAPRAVLAALALLVIVPIGAGMRADQLQETCYNGDQAQRIATCSELIDEAANPTERARLLIQRADARLGLGAANELLDADVRAAFAADTDVAERELRQIAFGARLVAEDKEGQERLNYLEQAETAYTLLLHHQSETSDNYAMRAFVRRLAGDLQGALQDLTAAERLNPGSVDADYCTLFVALGNDQNAMPYCDAALVRDRNPPLRAIRAALHMRQGDFEKAHADYLRAADELRTDPYYSGRDAYRYLYGAGEALRRAGRLDEGQELIDEALSWDAEAGADFRSAPLP